MSYKMSMFHLLDYCFDLLIFFFIHSYFRILYFLSKVISNSCFFYFVILENLQPSLSLIRSQNEIFLLIFDNHILLLLQIYYYVSYDLYRFFSLKKSHFTYLSIKVKSHLSFQSSVLGDKNVVYIAIAIMCKLTIMQLIMIIIKIITIILFERKIFWFYFNDYALENVFRLTDLNLCIKRKRPIWDLSITDVEYWKEISTYYGVIVWWWTYIFGIVSFKKATLSRTRVKSNNNINKRYNESTYNALK